ncbi:MAG: PHP domain-containing protein [Candidatus Woesearchaeota archaeon]
MKFDMHIHTKYSRCSNLEPAQILRQAKKIGLDGVGVVDHGTFKGPLAVLKLNKDKNFKVIVGEEVYTDKGHVLAFNINEEIKDKELMVVLDKIRDQGGISIAAHPFRELPHLRFKIPLKEISRRIDAIEGLNGRVMFNHINIKAQEEAKKLNKPITGGSDGHFSYEIGSCMSIFEGSLEKAIRSNKIQVESTKFYGFKGYLGGLSSFILKRIP